MLASKDGKVGKQGEHHQPSDSTKLCPCGPGDASQFDHVGKTTVVAGPGPAGVFQAEGFAEGRKNEETQEAGMCQRGGMVVFKMFQPF